MLPLRKYAKCTGCIDRFLVNLASVTIIPHLTVSEPKFRYQRLVSGCRRNKYDMGARILPIFLQCPPLEFSLILTSDASGRVCTSRYISWHIWQLDTISTVEMGTIPLRQWKRVRINNVVSSSLLKAFRDVREWERCKCLLISNYLLSVFGERETIIIRIKMNILVVQ